jgi:hypothetical protein
MATTYNLIHEGRRLGLAYVSPHPDYADHMIVTVVPLERKGKWESPSLEIHFEAPVHDIFPDTEDEVEAVKNVVAQAAIEASNVQVEPQSDPTAPDFAGAGAGSAAASVIEGHAPMDEEGSPAAETCPADAETFRRLAAEWKSQAEFLTSPTAIAGLPAYRTIIAMGPAAVPLILGELRREPDHWFVALERITGEDPVPSDARGDIDRMAEAWLHWGREHDVPVQSPSLTGISPS